MSRLVFLLLPVLAGAAMATQAAVNSQLRAAVHSPFVAALLSFVVGTLALGTVVLATGHALPPLRVLRALPPYLFTGGLLGGFFVTATVVSVPRIGTASLFACVLAGQLLAALFFDQYHLLGVPGQALTVGRGVGVLLVLTGVYFINRN